MVGHVYLSTNVYEDLYKFIASFGMNIIVLIAMWLDWKEQKEN